MAALAPVVLASRVRASQPTAGGPIGPLSPEVLPPGIRSRFVDAVNGLRMHVLEAGYQTPGRPGILLIHGFPELAYSWRKIIVPLAAAGYHVFAPDMRGYGRTSPTPMNYDDDLRPFGTVNRIRDMLALVSAMGHRSLAARTAAEWAKLPRYYVMDLDQGMTEQVAIDMPAPTEIAANRWLPDAELAVYAEEYGRTGFQGGLNGYRGAACCECRHSLY